MQSGSDGRSPSYHCHLPFPNLWRHFFGVPVIHVSIIIPGNPHWEGDTRCMWQLELYSLPQRDSFFYPWVFLPVSTFMHQCEKCSCALRHKTTLLISMLCAKTKQNTLDVFICALEMCSYFSDLKKQGGKWGQVFAQFVVLEIFWFVFFYINGVSAKITKRCGSGGAELFFRYFVLASACFYRSHLSAAHNMERNDGGK